MQRTILEFVTDRGKRVIQAWLADKRMRGKTRDKVRAELDSALDYIKAEEHPCRPQVADLRGEGLGLYEIRFTVNNKVYRPLYFNGPEDQEATLLSGATKKGGRFEPPSIISVAQARRHLAMQDRRYVCDYYC